MCTFVLELQHVLVHQFEKEHRPTVLFNAKSKSTKYAEKIIKVLKAFVDITVNFSDTEVTLYIYKYFSGFHHRA